MNNYYQSIGMGNLTRQPFPSELMYFKKNKHVAGMATDDAMVILNPYSDLSGAEKERVYQNEVARLNMRYSNNRPSFSLTSDQQSRLGNYSNNIQDIRETIVGRIASGDSSAGRISPEQWYYTQNRPNYLIGGFLSRYGY